MLRLIWTAPFWILNIPIIVGQQLEGHYEPYELLGLSKPCLYALNTTVESCPAWLRNHAGYTEPSLEIVPPEPLKELCETSCLDDLTELRKEIQNACNEPSDVLVPVNIVYPATFIVDRWLYVIELSCLKDPTSGKYCDTIVSDWLSNGAEYTTEQKCSYCELGLQQKQLASPFGYSEEGADEFSSLTSSCSKTTYTYATPTYPSTTLNYVFPQVTVSAVRTPVPVELPPLNPHAPGSPDDCLFFDDPFIAVDDLGIDMAACETWAEDAGVDLWTFVQWNPSLDYDNCTMDLGYSYCTARPPPVRGNYPFDFCFATNKTLIPETSLQPPDCDCYIQFRKEDRHFFDCTTFESLFESNTSAVAVMNPWISTGSDCEESVFKGSFTDGYIQICVHASSSVTVTASASAEIPSGDVIDEHSPTGLLEQPGF
ncbi:hypothetical protein BJY04DRAFT_69909 [Aspergillus karnatakaensis]|uniref:uncharacterized protein n=1 Tax=Aspergillus karnatakaensis TaxID=1810916 RepID=UPI003CCDEF6F